ncbi:MAG: hypothetical protein JOY85_15530, partial [Acidobacteriaceae bacterium]|nr:hypothetical protein [Acidobacteriaceae bacterium]
MRESTRPETPQKTILPQAVSREARRIVLVAVPPVRTLDVYGPIEVFGDANRLHGSNNAYQIDVVSAMEEHLVTSHTDLPLLANRTYTELRGPVDTLLV